MAGIDDLVSLREQLGTQPAPPLPYVPPPAPKAQPNLGIVPGMTYSANMNGTYSGLSGKGLMGTLGLSPAEAWIIQHESGGRPDAWNKTPVYSNGTYLGHAFGLGQLVDTNRTQLAKQLGISDPNTTDPRQQLAMFRAYYTGRYGSDAAAQAWWQAHGWY